MKSKKVKQQRDSESNYKPSAHDEWCRSTTSDYIKNPMYSTSGSDRDLIELMNYVQNKDVQKLKTEPSKWVRFWRNFKHAAIALSIFVSAILDKFDFTSNLSQLLDFLVNVVSCIC